MGRAFIFDVGRGDGFVDAVFYYVVGAFGGGRFVGRF